MNIPDFDNIPISTKTIILESNWKIDTKQLFHVLPVCDYKYIQKKRGRKSKNDIQIVQPVLEDGSIISLQLGENFKGVNMKPNKRTNYFRNNLTVLMSIGNKYINMKISKNGVIQLTGCKTDDQAQKCIEFIKTYVDQFGDGRCMTTICKSNPVITFISVMTNKNFNIGFEINREGLDECIDKNTNFFSLLDPSHGYSGANIKIPVTNLDEVILRRIIYSGGTWVRDDVTYPKYIESLDEKRKVKEKAKNRFTTFLAFSSGNIILSSIHEDCAKIAYKNFTDLMVLFRTNVELISNSV